MYEKQGESSFSGRARHALLSLHNLSFPPPPAKVPPSGRKAWTAGVISSWKSSRPDGARGVSTRMPSLLTLFHIALLCGSQDLHLRKGGGGTISVHCRTTSTRSMGSSLFCPPGRIG